MVSFLQKFHKVNSINKVQLFKVVSHLCFVFFFNGNACGIKSVISEEELSEPKL